MDETEVELDGAGVQAVGVGLGTASVSPPHVANWSVLECVVHAQESGRIKLVFIDSIILFLSNMRPKKK